MSVSDHTRKVLWARSGNRCAICKVALVTPATAGDRESIVGEECHIRARSPLGARGDSTASDGRDAYDNLLLLCRLHHKEVDDQRNTYTIEKLRSIKSEHEAWVEATLTTAAGPRPLFTLPNTHRRNPFFLADEHLAAVLDSFRAGENLVIHGPPGVGKTQHAVQHAQDRRDQYAMVLWIPADSVLSFEQGLMALADLTLPADPNAFGRTRIEALRAWLAEAPHWLLVIDNADTTEVQAAIERFVPSSHAGRVIVTSQISAWTAGFRTEPIRAWNEEESLAFFARRLSAATALNHGDRGDLAAIAADLGGLPLALEHCAAYLSETKVSAGHYRQLLRRDLRHVLQRRHAGMTAYHASISSTWLVAVQRLGWLARQILLYVAGLAQEPIPRSILAPLESAAASDWTYSPRERSRLRREFDAPDAVNLALGELERYSLASLSEDSFWLHPLLQRVLLDTARLHPWEWRYWRCLPMGITRPDTSRGAGMWLYRTAHLLDHKGVLPVDWENVHAMELNLRPFMGHLQALLQNVDVIAPRLKDVRFAGNAMRLEWLLRFYTERAMWHQNGTAILCRMLEENAMRSEPLSVETEWLRTHLDELYLQVVGRPYGSNLGHVLRRLATDVGDARRGMYSFLRILAAEQAAIGATDVARRLYRLYVDHASSDPEAPELESAFAQLCQALALCGHLPGGEVRQLLEDGLSQYEGQAQGNLKVWSAMYLYSLLAETDESQANAVRWMRQAIPKARSYLEHGCDHACALTEEYIRLTAGDDPAGALQTCEETLRIALRSRKLARGNVGALWERRAHLLLACRRFIPAARSFARCLAIEKHNEQASPLRFVRLHTIAGTAYLHGSALSAARTHLIKAHELLAENWPEDSTEVRSLALEIGQALEQVGEADRGEQFIRMGQS